MAPLTLKCISHTKISADQIDLVESAIKGLGADLSKDLGSRHVHYLVVGERFTEKYNYCVDRSPSTLLISPETLLNVHQSYIRGEDFDVLEFFIENKLKVFSGLKITMSSMTEEMEKHVAGLVNCNGGEFKRTLTKDIDIVLSNSLTGKKIKFAEQWRIPIVVPKWVEESVERGVSLPPKSYLTREYKEKASTPETQLPVETADSLISLDFKAGPKRKTADDWDDLFVPNNTKAATALPPRRSLSVAAADTTTQQLGMFSGIAFTMQGFNDRESNILRKTIRSHDGNFLPPFDFMIVNSKNPPLPPDNSAIKVITEWAVERSLYRKSSMLSDDWGQPVYTQNLREFKDVKICLSGFRDIELVHLERLVGLLGAKLQTSLTVDRDVLIAASTSCQKFKYAKAWNIPIASEQWLWDCAKSGRMLEITSQYALDGKPRTLGATADSTEHYTSNPPVDEPQQAYIDYGSDDEHQTPVGRDFIKRRVLRSHRT